MLFCQDGADEADDGAAVGEDADDVGAAADFAVEAFVGVVRPDLSPEVSREGGEGDDLGAGVVEVGVDFGQAGLELVWSWSRSLSYWAWTAPVSIWSNTECSIALTPPHACLGHTLIRLAV